MNQIADILNAEMQENNLSAAAVAAFTNYSPAAISNYLNKKRQIPKELISKLADKMNSARLKIWDSMLCGCGLFKTPYLEVDKHPSTIKMVVDEELQEALEAYRKAPVKNKLHREDFDPEEWAAYEEAMEQLCDIHALIEAALESGQKYYGLDVDALEKKIAAKLKAKGYTKEKPLARAVVRKDI